MELQGPQTFLEEEEKVLAIQKQFIYLIFNVSKKFTSGIVYNRIVNENLTKLNSKSTTMMIP